MKDEKLEIRKKPQQVKKEDLDKVGGGKCTPMTFADGCGLVSNVSKSINSHC